MSQFDELKRLAEAVRDSDIDWEPNQKSYDYFQALRDPRVVLALIAENERLHESDQEATELCDTLSVLLGEIAVAVRGPEEPKSRHGFHDLPSRVKTVVAERDQLKAELDCPFRLARHSKRLVEQLRAQAEQYDQALIKMAAERDQLRAEVAGLRTGYEAYERVNAELKAEVGALRKLGPSKEIIWCACGDGYPVNSYGAGFMDANNGVCANCDAALGQGEQS